MSLGYVVPPPLIPHPCEFFIGHATAPRCDRCGLSFERHYGQPPNRKPPARRAERKMFDDGLVG